MREPPRASSVADSRNTESSPEWLRAIIVIRFVLNAFNEGGLYFGQWESGCLNAALNRVRDGFFAMAIADASRALLPPPYRDHYRVLHYRCQPGLKETQKSFERLYDAYAGELAKGLSLGSIQ